MCGRYTLATPDPAALRERFPIGESVAVRRRYNIAPGDEVLAVTTDRHGAPRGEYLRWGFVPSWARSPQSALRMINARVETVQRKPAYRRAFERFRCLIPADGFYEWRRLPDGGKQPFHIARADREIFAFAGLWSIWHGPDGRRLRTCTILTIAANAAIAPLHDRMPVILERSAERAWLEPDTPPARLIAMLTPLDPSATALRPVSSAVNDARYDGPECLAPPDRPGSAQPALF